MCEFSHEGSTLVDVPYEQALLGYRFFRSNWKEKDLKSLNRDFEYINKLTESEHIPTLYSDIGIYSYNNYNYNYNYNYYYYNYNYYNSYYYNYNYYSIGAIIKSYNKVVIHSDRGYRAQSIEILALLSLRSNESKKFLKHFNNHIDIAAFRLNIPVLPWQNGEPIPTIGE